MENLDNYKIDNLDISFQRKGDLLYHEGPLLSHFVNSSNPNEHYFYKWSDCDEICNRWLIFKVTLENLTSFFKGNLTLLHLIQKNKSVYFVDFDTNINEVNAFNCPVQKIPDDYLPSERSYFKEKQYEKYAMILKNELEKRANEQNMFIELLKKVNSIEEQQKKTNKLLTQILDILNEQDSTSKISKLSEKATVYQDDLLNRFTNQSNNYYQSSQRKPLSIKMTF